MHNAAIVTPGSTSSHRLKGRAGECVSQDLRTR